MTLLQLLDSWTDRYALSSRERSDLATEVSHSLDGPTKHPPMPVDLAYKLGLRTYRDAVARFLEERLAHPTTVAVEEPTMGFFRDEAPSAVRRVRDRQLDRCSACGKTGHRRTTCDLFNPGRAA